MKKPYKNTRIKIIIFTVFLALSLCSVSLFSATPSYSNFSSNQFAPSGTYTVTVKNQPKLTNIIEHAQLSLTNPAFANSLIYITNMTGTNGLTNTMVFVSYYGPQVQFSWMTNGIGSSNISMVISNGMVGIGKGNPAYALDVIGQITSSLNMNAGADMNVGAIAGGNSKVNFSSRAVMFSPAKSYITLFENTFVTNGGAIIFPDSTNVLSTHETATNTVIGSQGTNLWIGDGITADATYGQFRQFSFQTSGTPVMVISNGMVGIGKANPTYPLDVSGTVGATTVRSGNGGLNSTTVGSFAASSGFDINGLGDGLRFITWNNGGYWAGGQMYSNGVITLSASTNSSLFVNDNSTNTAIFSQGTNLVITDGITANGTFGQFTQFSFQTSGTPVMVISNGMVGIGKANPGSALDVVGTINGSSDINPGGSSGIKFGANNDIAMSYSTDISGFMRHSALNGFQFKTFSGGTYNEKVRINTNGTVFFRGSTVINSNEFPITANFANMTPCGCAFWMSNFTMYLICTNSEDHNATTNKLGGL